MLGDSSQPRPVSQRLYQNILIFISDLGRSSTIPGVFHGRSGFSLPVAAVWAKMPSFHFPGAWTSPGPLPALPKSQELFMPSRRDRANAIRALSMDAVQKANSGHGCANGHGGYRRSALEGLPQAQPGQPAMG